jgi:cytoskeletal protein RodZ
LVKLDAIVAEDCEGTVKKSWSQGSSLTGKGDPCIIQPVAWLEGIHEYWRVGNRSRAMAQKSRNPVRLTTAASILVALGLAGCLWVVVGCSRVRLSPAFSPLSTVIPPSNMSSLPIGEFSATPSPWVSETARSTVAPSPSYTSTATPAATRLPPPSPTIQPSITPVPSPISTPTATQAPSPEVVPETEAAGPFLSPLEGETGPEVGQKALDFSLLRAQGGIFTLSDLRDRRKAVLVFYRTAG